MKKAPISVVIPTYNEESTIASVLDKLTSQTLLPEEILISDSHSSDNTRSIIKNYKTDHVSIILLDRIGKCRGSGRNEGIDKASNEIIALVDSGIYPEKDWLEELYSCYSGDKDKVIFGAVKPLINSKITRSLGSFIVGKVNGESIIPSVGSMLFHKEIWNEVGKFKESSQGKYVVEDLDFIEKIKQKGYELRYNFKACSDWEISKSYQEIYKRFSNYSQGTFENGLFMTWHLGTVRNTIIYISFLFLSLTLNLNFLICIFLFHSLRTFSYLIRTKWYKKGSVIEKILDFFNLSLILVIIDFSTYKGIFDSFLRSTRGYRD